MDDFQVKIDPIWKKKDVVGIDIGTRTVKVVQLKKSGHLTKLVGYGQIKVPDNYIIEGIIAEPEKLAKLITDFFSNGVWGKITAKRVCSSLPESKVFTRTITLPHMAGKELDDAVNWEAGQTIPMALTDLYLDYEVIGPSAEDPKNDEIIYTAAPKAIVNSYVQLFSLMGLEIDGIENSLTAIIRSMVPKKNDGVATLVIDIGGQTTNMAIFDHLISVTGSTLIGGDHLTYKISQALGVSEKEAEIAKKSKEKDIEKVKTAIETEIDQIVKEATRMINYYEGKDENKKKVQRVLLCGGGASLPALEQIFTEKLGVPTIVGNPWANISVYPIKTVPHEDVPAFTNAVGLALLGVNDDGVDTTSFLSRFSGQFSAGEGSGSKKTLVITGILATIMLVLAGVGYYFYLSPTAVASNYINSIKPVIEGYSNINTQSSLESVSNFEDANLGFSSDQGKELEIRTYFQKMSKTAQTITTRYNDQSKLVKKLQNPLYGDAQKLNSDIKKYNDEINKDMPEFSKLASYFNAVFNNDNFIKLNTLDTKNYSDSNLDLIISTATAASADMDKLDPPRELSDFNNSLRDLTSLYSAFAQNVRTYKTALSNNDPASANLAMIQMNNEAKDIVRAATILVGSPDMSRFDNMTKTLNQMESKINSDLSEISNKYNTSLLRITPANPQKNSGSSA